MQAILYDDYGPADVLKLQHIDKPSPGDKGLLVQVRAASINPLDWHMMRGIPYLMRLGSGLRRPKEARIGVDFAGTVEAIGKNVTQFVPGDDVFGVLPTGALAEYVTVRADQAFVHKPSNMSFEQAAALPVAGITALQAVRDHGRVQAGQKVLINGASGGVGTFAVQIAKVMGADVTGVCSTGNVEMVRSIGADHVVDYTQQDFTTAHERYDFILDNVGNRTLSEFRRVLKPGAKLVANGGGSPDSGRWIGPLGRVLGGYVLSRFVGQEMGFFLADVNQKDLTILRDLMEAGKVLPVIDRRYKLTEVPAAIRYLETGHARGKVLIVVG